MSDGARIISTSETSLKMAVISELAISTLGVIMQGAVATAGRTS
ncbi:hypothetical protein ACFFRL_15200 [Agromyces hippuratus]